MFRSQIQLLPLVVGRLYRTGATGKTIQWTKNLNAAFEKAIETVGSAESKYSVHILIKAFEEMLVF